MAEPAAIEITNLAFSYGGEEVLSGVNLTLVEKDLASIVGPNGGGKTTLLKLILGLLTPASGQIRVFGTSPERARRRVGYMPQIVHFDPQFPVSVLDVVLMGRLGLGRGIGPYGGRERDAARRALIEVGLDAFRRRPFSMLSGGQRQRVLMARALACEPDMLLMDEPTANLDPRVLDDFYELCRRLSGRLTLVLVSHDVGFVSKIVRTVVCVNRTVSVHSTADLSGGTMQALYGSDVRMVRHDHCAGRGDGP